MLRFGLPLFFLLAITAFAQDASTGAIRGLVSDSFGGRIPNASIAFVNNSTGFRYITTSDADGPTIRKAVSGGDLARAERMLGRPFSVLGSVEGGDQIGRKLGYPTANLNPHNEVLPPNGVYVVRALHEKKKLSGIVNIGVRPTMAAHATDRRFELHVLDFSGDLYGKTLEVSFVQKLRDEQKFDSPEMLKA